MSRRGGREGHGCRSLDMAATAETREERIEAQLDGLPAKPGVYLFRGPRDAVLYVGKAKSLRPRVRSYFRAGDTRLGLDRMVARVERVEVIVTQTEAEALHLEQNLIRRHRPPFNVRLRDDKSYPYIAVTVEDEYPRVMFTRERHRRGVVYFGPYANAKVRETLDVLNRVFPTGPARPAAGPALRDPVPRLPHRTLPGPVRRLRLEGRLPVDHRRRDRVPLGRDAADPAPARGEDERRCRGGGSRRRRATGTGSSPSGTWPSGRPPTSARSARSTCSGSPPRTIAPPCRSSRSAAGGSSTGTRSTSRTWPAGHARATRGLRLEYYESAPAVPPQIVVPRDAGENEALEQYLSELRGSHVEVRPARRGEKRRLQELATQNAELALQQDAAESERKRLRRVEALEELREALNLESLPLRIECFDISNIQETAPVGSMVVFQDAVPKRPTTASSGSGTRPARTTSR